MYPNSFLFCNQEESGKLPLKNFSHSEYHGHFQNWAVIQDHRGIIYVANNNGILEYDGNQWSNISVNGATTRSLALDEAGRIWVGAQDELGYLAADSLSQMSYYSVLHLLGENKQIGLVRQVYATQHGVYFCTNSCIIRIKGNEVKKWCPKTIFHRIYCIKDSIYSFQPEVGLTVLKGDTMLFVKGSETLIPKRIYAMMPYDKSRILIGSQADGFYLLNVSNKSEVSDKDEEILTPFKTSNDDFFKNNWVYNGVRLPNGWFAIATYRGGVVVINDEGTVLQYIRKEQGIQDETAWHLTYDNQENIWIALNYGVSYSALISPITSWDVSSGLQGVLQSVNRFNGKLYVSSNAGVFYLENKHFHRVEGILDLSWDIVKVKSSDGKIVALVATGDGIYQLDNGKAKKLTNANDATFRIYQSKYHKDIVYLGLYDGLGVLSYQKGQWVYLGRFDNVSNRIYTITEDDEGNLWYSVRFKYITCTKISDPRKLVIDSQDIYDKIPYDPLLDEDTKLVFVNGQIKLSTSKGLTFFNSEKRQFEIDSSLGLEFTTGETGISIFGLDSFYNLWFESSKDSYSRNIERAILNPEGAFIRLTTELNEIPKGNFYSVFTEPDGISWIAGADGLFRFDPQIDKRGRKIPRVLIRKVLDAQKKPIFKGAFQQTCADGFFHCTGLIQQNNDIPIISYSDNSITFYFSSPFFGQEDIMLYSFILEGFEKNWSEWSSSNTKEYTNLPHGTYRFLVKALNVYEVEGPIASFSFTVERPWYLHPLVYLGYFIAFVLFVALMVSIKTRMLKASNIKLQKLVDERTNELLQNQKDILEKNEELKQQKEQILSQNEELLLKNMQTSASIQYALTIQQAILPEKKIMNLYFENFIIYRPKDVVSGDFYWFSHIPIKNNKPAKEIIAIVDCTGHGVPGAFMSMIGSRMLSEVVNERGITNPSKILVELNRMLNFVLHQDSTENFDGMDVAICSIEKISSDKYSICFAGANRPISFYKKENIKIENIKGNRKYIGGFLPDIDENFQDHTFVLESGDSLFLYSDGLTDQNNEHNKKFSTGRFESILISNIDKPMLKIEKILEEAFDSFKGDVLQRDDITVIGIRLK